MAKTIGIRCRASLIRDLIDADQDLMTLAKAHNLKPDDLAAWINDPKNSACLSGICVLADLQTQLLLSRYRLLAAGRLVKLATDSDEHNSADISRRACVDLLKLDLKRADIAMAGLGGEDESDNPFEPALREALYGAISQEEDRSNDEG